MTKSEQVTTDKVLTPDFDLSVPFLIQGVVVGITIVAGLLASVFKPELQTNFNWAAWIVVAELCFSVFYNFNIIHKSMRRFSGSMLKERDEASSRLTSIHKDAADEALRRVDDLVSPRLRQIQKNQLDFDAKEKGIHTDLLKMLISDQIDSLLKNTTNINSPFWVISATLFRRRRALIGLLKSDDIKPRTVYAISATDHTTFMNTNDYIDANLKAAGNGVGIRRIYIVQEDLAELSCVRRGIAAQCQEKNIDLRYMISADVPDRLKELGNILIAEYHGDVFFVSRSAESEGTISYENRKKAEEILGPIDQALSRETICRKIDSEVISRIPR